MKETTVSDYCYT